MKQAEARAEFAEAEVASLLDQAAFHKRMVWKHRKQLQECMAEVERLRREAAERLGLQVEIVPLAQSQEAESHEHHPRT